MCELKGEILGTQFLKYKCLAFKKESRWEGNHECVQIRTIGAKDALPVAGMLTLLKL